MLAVEVEHFLSFGDTADDGAGEGFAAKDGERSDLERVFRDADGAENAVPFEQPEVAQTFSNSYARIYDAESLKDQK